MTGDQFMAHALFFLFAFLVVGGSIAMLVSRNFVQSAVYLAVSLLSFAGLYAMLSASFLALVQIFVYAGAVTVVMLFVVMLTRERVSSLGELLQRQGWLALGVVIALTAAVFQVLEPFAAGIRPSGAQAAGVGEIAAALLNAQAAPFEIASVVLLAALIGSIYLAREAD
jgi:NADH-quinone oxidoreductase subunit J